MKIMESSVFMQSDRLYAEEQFKEESLRTWIGDKRPDFEGETSNTLIALTDDRVTISAESIRKQFPVVQKSDSSSNNTTETINEDPKTQSIRLILESLTGKKIIIKNANEFIAKPPDQPIQSPDSSANNQERVGWGLEYDYFEQYHEEEMTNFSSQGTILSKDGKQINFTIELVMQRDFVETNSISIRAGDALIDPLVINFGGKAADLTDIKFDFDLDSDGSDEQISFVKPASGFLFLDQDNNGVATNGNELFGPKTNHGFQELAHYDLDKNGWIDENDPIYEKLMIWSKDKAGNDYFSSLKQKNIGAIFLDHQNTEFSLKNQDNLLQGKILNTGVFMSNDYKAGTIQEIHLTV